MYKIRFILLVVWASIASSCAQNNVEKSPKIYTAFQTSEEILVDGKALENVWSDVKWSDSFIDIEGLKIPAFNTRFKMLWDSKHLYLLVDIEEPHVWADLKQRDTIIFHNNDFELFIDPDGDTHNYYEIELNALNTVWDLFLTKPYRDGNTILNDWTLTGLQSAVSVNGTINNSSDTDKGWVLEMAIPWKAFKKSYFEKNIPIDSFWRMNFSRVNWQFDIEGDSYKRKIDKKGKLLHEYNWVWSPMGVINMHEPEKWGYVFFSSKAPGAIENFKISPDEKIKWALYGLYRAQKSHFKKYKKFVKNIDSLSSTPMQIEGKTIKPQLENHKTGWTLSVRSPFTDKVLYVKHDGKFISDF